MLQMLKSLVIGIAAVAWAVIFLIITMYLWSSFENL